MSHRFELVSDQLQVLLPDVLNLFAPRSVGLLVARSGHQPSVGIPRDALAGPAAQRCSEGVGERVFGARHVTSARSQKGQNATVTFARHALDGAARIVHGRQRFEPDWSSIGRISIEPYLLEGQRLAHAMASSRLGTSTTK